MELKYTYQMLVSDIAEILDKSGLGEKFEGMDQTHQEATVYIVVGQLASFMLGRYNMSYQNSTEVIRSFDQTVDSDKEQFCQDILNMIKLDQTGGGVQ